MYQMTIQDYTFLVYCTFMGKQEMQFSSRRIVCPVNQKVLQVLLLKLFDPEVPKNILWCFLYCYFHPYTFFYFLVLLCLTVRG